MFFEHIELHDFRSHVETILSDLDRITVVRGPNAAGKSSLGQAFGYLLAGRSADTGENGQGGENLIRKGQKKAMILAKLRHGPKMRLTLTAKSGRDLQVRDGELPKFSRDVYSCLCSSRYFIELPSKRQQEILSAMVIPPDAPLPERVIQLAVQCGLAPHEELAAIDWLTTVHEQAFNARRDAKRDLRNLVPVPAPPEAGPSVEQVRERLRERRIQRDEKRDEVTRLRSAHVNWEKSYGTLDQRLRVLNQRIEIQSQAVTVLRAQMLSDAERAKHRKTMEREPERERLHKDYEDAERELQAYNAQRDVLLKLEGEKACPTCSQPLTEQAVSEAMKPIGDQIGKRLTKRSEAAKALGAIPSVEDAKAAIARDTHAREQSKVEQERLEQMQADARQIAEELRGLGTEPAQTDTATLESDIADLERRIAEGEKAERAAMNAQANAKAHAAYVAKAAELEAQVGALEGLVEMTEPTGLPAKLAEQYAGAFEASLFAVLDQFGYPATRHLGEWRLADLEIDRLSHSEQLRFGVAFQIALAIATGAGFVVIDEFDALDANGRGTLMQLLMNDERIEQAIVIGTNESTRVPDLIGITAYRFERREDGTSAAILLMQEQEEAIA